MPTMLKKGQKPNQPSYMSTKSRSQDKKQQAAEKIQLDQKWDINMKHIMQNTQTMERVHTLTSVLAGVIAGLFNANLYSGIFAYLFFHIIITLLVAVRIDKINNYFMRKADLVSGLGSGVPVFLCCWIIVYNVVYTL